MVLTKESSTPNTAGAASPPPAQNDAFNATPPGAQDYAPFFAQFGGRGGFGGFGGGRGGWGGRGWGGGRGGGRGWGGRDAFWQDLFNLETVSLEGDEPGLGPRGHHPGPPPPPGHHHPFWPPPPPPPHPDPPLAATPSGVPEPPYFGPGADAAGLAGLFGHHARNFAGDLAAHFGAPPSDDPMHRGPGFGHGRFGHHRGRGGPGGRGRGGWRGAWPGHHHGHGFAFPRMDIYRKGNTYTVKVNLPGLQKKDVELTVTDGLLSISGEFPSDKPSSGGGGGGGGGEDPFDEYDIFDGDGEEVLMESATLNNDNDHNDEDDGHYIRHERPSGKFKRSLRLPSWVKVEAIQASMAEGVLTLVIEKPAPEGTPSSTRKLEIH